MSTTDDRAANEVRRLRHLIMWLVFAVVLVGGFVFWVTQRQDSSADCARQQVEARVDGRPEPSC
jgi:uncharacterized Tic20 family protein